MKNCLFCTWFELFYEGDYSDITPGAGMVVGCRKGHWQFHSLTDTEKDFRRQMSSAETCKEYSQVSEESDT